MAAGTAIPAVVGLRRAASAGEVGTRATGLLAQVCQDGEHPAVILGGGPEA
jgi:uncharacterized protein YdbL (DUF1318 family)